MKANSLTYTMLFIALSFLLGSNVMAQNTADSSEAKNEDMIFKVADQMPEYMGGEQALYQYLGDNIRYPDTAIKFGVEGKVVINFVVDEKGYVRDATASTTFGFGLEEEAIRVISNMPKWKPGVNEGVAVKCYFRIPIKFTLPVEEEPVLEESPPPQKP